MKKGMILLLAAFTLACEEKDVQLEGSIKYGTSFGECLGYCVTEAEVLDEELKVVQKSWDSQLEDIESNRSLSSEEVESIINGIDTDKFKVLDETIGCPDCADGGAEWIELIIEGEVKRVTFEYMASIDGINPAVEMLRSLVEETVADE